MGKTRMGIRVSQPGNVRCWGNSYGFPDEWNNGGRSHVDCVTFQSMHMRNGICQEDN